VRVLTDTMDVKNAPAQGALTGCRVLVVEDDYFQADDIRDALHNAGAEVIGPVPTLAEAMTQVHNKVDAVVLDIELRGTPAWPLAEMLGARQVPFMFATGFGPEVMPSTYADVPYWAKPLDADRLVMALAALIKQKVPRATN